MPAPFALAGALLLQVAAPADADFHDTPHWIRLPTVAEVTAAYPPVARSRAVRGDAVLACTLDADGWLRGCRVAAEAPAEMGFGQAALSLAGAFRMSPLTASGASVEGRPIEAPIHFAPGRRR